MMRPAPTELDLAKSALEARRKRIAELEKYRATVREITDSLVHQGFENCPRRAWALDWFEAELHALEQWFALEGLMQTREGIKQIVDLPLQHFTNAEDALREYAKDVAANPNSERDALNLTSAQFNLKRAAEAALRSRPLFKSPLFEIFSSSQSPPVVETLNIARQAEAFDKRLSKPGQRPGRGVSVEFYSVVRGEMLREIVQGKQARQQEGRDLAPGELVRDLHWQCAYAVAYELRYLPAPGEPWTRAHRITDVAFEYRWRLVAEALGIPLSPEGHHGPVIDALGIAALDAADEDKLAAHKAKVAADRDRVEAEKRAAQAREDQAKQAENDRAEKAIAEGRAKGMKPGDIVTTTAAGGGVLIIKMPPPAA